jgi:hypothetical protein
LFITSSINTEAIESTAQNHQPKASLAMSTNQNQAPAATTQQTGDGNGSGSGNGNGNGNSNQVPVRLCEDSFEFMLIYVEHNDRSDSSHRRIFNSALHQPRAA